MDRTNGKRQQIGKLKPRRYRAFCKTLAPDCPTDLGTNRLGTGTSPRRANRKLTDVERYSAKDEYIAACDSGYVPQKGRYRSDGLAVITYFYYSRDSEGTKRPVIVFNCGSFAKNDIASELLPRPFVIERQRAVVGAPPDVATGR
jgi:hypothetical protein